MWLIKFHTRNFLQNDTPQVGRIVEDGNNSKYYLRITNVICCVCVGGGETDNIHKISKSCMIKHLSWISGSDAGVIHQKNIYSF